MKKKNISIKEIARLSGVSTATVSNVINKKGRYTPETEAKVNQVIKQFGYISNAAAKSLRVSETHTVGLIVPNIRNEFFAYIASAIENYFHDRSYSVFICNSSNDAEREKAYFRQLDEQRVDGILCISGQKVINHDIISRDIPIILIDRDPANDMNLPIVQSDDYSGIKGAVEILLKKGCRHFLYVSSRTSQYSSGKRKTAFLDTLNNNMIAVSEDRILKMRDSSPSNEQAEELVTRFLFSGKPVDAIVCASDNSALGALAAVKRAHLRIPEDVKVFGFDNSFSSSISSPTLSTIGRDPDQIAITASEKLYHMLKGEEDNTPNRIILPVDIIERDSTR